MIDGNILKFGYGDIAVGADPTGDIKFQQFKPPAECGDTVSNGVEYIGEKIVIHLNYDEYCELKKHLKAVRYKKPVFEFKGYRFDFTNYNEKSIEVCEKFANAAMRWYFICSAA